MNTEGNQGQTGIASQCRSPDGILLPSEVFQACAPASMSARANLTGISVAVVKEPHSSQVLSDWIRDAEGFSLINCHSSADSALAALPNEKPSIVLIDLNLPGVGVSKCLRQLKPILQQTQFVTLNADEDADGTFKALAAGATGYLWTQTPHAEVIAALKLIHAGGSPISPVIAKKVLQSFQNSSRLNAAAELSPREIRLLRLLSNGSSHDEAATILNISLPMVSTYIRSIYEKLQMLSNATPFP